MSTSQQLSQILHNPDTNLSDFVKTKGKRVLGQEYTVTLIPQGSSQPQFGSTVTFRIPTQGKYDFISNACVAVTYSAATLGGGGTYTSLCNYAGIMQFQKLELICGGSVISTNYPQAMLTQIVQQNSISRDLPILQQQLGYGTTTARRASTSGPQTFYLPLGEVLGLFNVPIPYSNLLIGTNLLELKFYLQPSVGYVLQSDSTNSTISITNMQMFVTYCTPWAGPLIYDIILKNGEYSFGSYDVVTQSFQTPTGSTTYNNALSNINNCQVLYLNHMSLLNTDMAPFVANWDNYQPLSTFSLKSSGQYIDNSTIETTYSVYQGVLWPSYNAPGRINCLPPSPYSNIYCISYSTDLSSSFQDDNVNEYTGSKDYTGLSAVSLNLGYSTSVSNAMTCQVVIFCWKPITLDAKNQIFRLA